MTFIEFLGFLISMFALIFLFLRRTFVEKYKQEHPEEYEKMTREREKALEEFFKSLEIEPEEPRAKKKKKEPEIAPAPPQSVRRKTRRSMGDDYEFKEFQPQLKSKIEGRRLEDRIAAEVRDITERTVVSDDLKISQLFELGAAPSRAKIIIEEGASKKDLFLAHEIFHRPRGLQPLIDANEFHLG